VTVWLTDRYTRAAEGGTGAAKCGGNYAASLLAQTEAMENGCDQVVFLDAAEHRWVEELGGMNVFLVMGDAAALRHDPAGHHARRHHHAGQAFWHCSAHCIQNCIGFIAAPAKAFALGQVPAGTPGKDFSFDSIADGAVIGFGDLICSS
jgi:hypothetical protein